MHLDCECRTRKERKRMKRKKTCKGTHYERLVFVKSSWFFCHFFSWLVPKSSHTYFGSTRKKWQNNKKQNLIRRFWSIISKSVCLELYIFFKSLKINLLGCPRILHSWPNHIVYLWLQRTSLNCVQLLWLSWLIWFWWMCSYLIYVRSKKFIVLYGGGVF